MEPFNMFYAQGTEAQCIVRSWCGGLGVAERYHRHDTVDLRLRRLHQTY
jgi:hypothetical protein